MRVIGKGLVNKLRIKDQISDSVVCLHYRLPSTEERVAYVREMTRREGGRLVDCSYETRIKKAAELLIGFDSGDFGVAAEDGSERPISSDPKHDNYAPDWLEIVTADGQIDNLLAVLALHVFEGARTAMPGEGAEKN